MEIDTPLYMCIICSAGSQTDNFSEGSDNKSEYVWDRGTFNDLPFEGNLYTDSSGCKLKDVKIKC